MKHTLFLIISIFTISVALGQTLKRQENETAELFAGRFKPDSSELDHMVVVDTSPYATQKPIIAFYKKSIHEVRQMKTYVDHSKYEILIGYLFVPEGDNNYKKLLIDTIQPNGGDPEILSIFFANADKDRSRELIVLCKYDQRHYDYNGSFYDTFIFDLNNGVVEYIDLGREKFFGCECKWRIGKTEKAKYKTEKDVITGLVRMGFKQ
jgi:hypothetical protein